MVDVFLQQIDDECGIWSLLLAIGLAITFLIHLVMTRVQIRGLKAQIVTNVGEHLGRLQAARNSYSASASRCAELAEELRQLIIGQQSRAAVDDCRNRFCRCFLEDTIRDFVNLVEWQFLDAEHRGSHVRLQVVRDAIDELIMFHEWLGVINRAHLLRTLKRGPARIQRRRLHPFLRLVESLPAVDRRQVQTSAQQAVYQLTQ